LFDRIIQPEKIRKSFISSVNNFDGSTSSPQVFKGRMESTWLKINYKLICVRNLSGFRENN